MGGLVACLWLLWLVPIHCFIPFPTNYRLTRLSAASDTQDQLEYDVERFRRRARLTEHVLETKLQDLQLAQAKLKVLQDTASQVKSSKDKDQRQWQSEMAELQARLTQSSKEVSASKQQLADEQARFTKQLNNMQNEYDKDRQEWQTLRRQLEKDLEFAKQRPAVLEHRVADLDDALESTEDELRRLRRQLEQQLSIGRELDRMKERLAEAEAARSNAEQELAQRSQSWNESLEIASAAVAAAERREQELGRRLEQLEAESDKQRAENLRLESTLNATLAKLQREESSSGVEVTTDEANKLQREVKELNEQLRALKLTHSAQLRSEQKKLKQEMEDLEDHYESLLSQRSHLTTVPQRISRAQRLWQNLKRPFSRT